ncbi:hypothetical protein BJX66DRAFT_299536 [Aspergillus keveii]|uniref:Zn(2)-C6 fungal-type domain-containing protein n=1 Tax=Aspergillus keveii TaxID=714993 RepID=A0ABR4GC79_9EURO
METRKTRAGAKACVSCRRRKVRCQIDPGMTKCRACHRRSSACIPSNVQNLLEPESAPFPQLESEPAPFGPFLDVSVFDGLPTPDLQPSPQLAQEINCDAPLPPLNNHFDSLFKAPETDADPFTSLLCFSLPGSLISRPDSLPFSIFSPEGKQWLHKTVGNEEFNSDILSPSIFGPDGIFGNSIGPSPLPQQFIHLPHKDIARSLLRTYFETCNSFCPTFEEHEFMLWFELQYPVAPDSSAEWACVNATLALACLLDQHFYSKAWLFWKNATLSWEAFMTRAPSLISAQALLTMTLYLLGTFHCNPSSSMIPMAVRILSGISPPEERMSQQFQFVRMVTQSLDLDHAIQAGVPPTEPGAVSHMLTPFNPELISDLDMPFDCYPAYCQLLELKEDVYRELYSLSAEDKADYEVIATVGKLDSRLEQLRYDIPEEYRPGHSRFQDTIKRAISDTLLHLHLSYYNSVLVIHRRSLSYGMRPSDSSLPSATRAHTAWSSNSRALIPTQLCAEAARATLRLVKYIPKHNPITRGLMFNYVVFALKLLVTLTVRDPHSPRARADILLMRDLEDVVSSIPVGHDERSIRNLIEYCTHYRDTAERAIDRVFSRKMPREHDKQS